MMEVGKICMNKKSEARGSRERDYIYFIY